MRSSNDLEIIFIYGNLRAGGSDGDVFINAHSERIICGCSILKQIQETRVIQILGDYFIAIVAPKEQARSNSILAARNGKGE